MNKETQEKICVERFLNWYNKQHKEIYVCEKTKDHFHELNGKLRWDFIIYQPSSPKEWLGVELKELATTREVSSWFKFWNRLCLELAEDLAGKGIHGKFRIIHPPVLNLKPEKRLEFRRVFVEVVINKQSMLNEDFVDIGPDIADKFPNWPKQKTRGRAEYHMSGKDRPHELLINKNPHSRCEVTSPSSPIVARDGVELHKKTFGEADIKHANKQLRLAREKGARKTILLFACYPFIEESLIKYQIQNLDRHIVSAIDSIYLVDMVGDMVGKKGRVVKIYPD